MRLVFLLLLIPIGLFAQTVNLNSSADQLNTITTAVPFANLSVDAISTGQAHIGVVSSSLYHQTAFSSNPALLANGRKFLSIRSNTTPIFISRSDNQSLLTSEFVSWGINGRHSVGLYHKYYSIGTIHFTDNQGNFIKEHVPQDHLIQLNYAAWFPNGISAGIAAKYIHSDLTGGLNIGGRDSHPGRSAAFDIGIHHRRHRKLSEHLGLVHAVGFSITNLGMKVGYVENADMDFIPTNMRIGIQLGISHQLGVGIRIEDDLSYQVSKMLVPTPPIYLTDSSGYVLDSEGQRVIASGMNTDVSVPMGMIQSFYDAPGGTKEEWREVIHQVAHEFRFIFRDKLSVHLRQGLHYQHRTKGNVKFVSLGAGVGFYGFRVDLAGRIPFGGSSDIFTPVSISVGYTAKLGLGSKLRNPSWRPEMENLYPSDFELRESEVEEAPND